MSDIKKHAVLIGINDIPNMDYLSAPSSYAIRMKHWAESQGYQTSLFVDEPNDETSGACNRSEILKTIHKVVDEGIDQLLIYFSGHGVEKSAGNDIWLLPGYEIDANDSIDLASNKVLAYTLGVTHVVFISDACRSPSTSQALRAATGGVILPNIVNINYKTVVDLLHSTWAGQMATDINDGTGVYRSIYSDCLLDCLNGDVPEVIKTLEDIMPAFPAVVSDVLNRYLKAVVPERTIAAGRRPQYPDGAVSSRDPLFLSKFKDEQADEQNVSFQNDSAEAFFPLDKSVEGRLKSFFRMIGKEEQSPLNKLIDDFTRNSRIFNPAKVLFKTTELVITGLDAPVAYVKYGGPWLPFSTITSGLDGSKSYRWPVRFSDEALANQFLVGSVEMGRHYVVNVLPHFVTHAAFKHNSLVSVDYYPTDPYLARDFEILSDEIIRRKANIILAADNGIFQGTEELADYIRRYKKLDPILGLFAAYAYFQKGKFENVESVFQYMREDNHPILFDVEMLNLLSSSKARDLDLKDFGLPVLTEGWSYLKLFKSHPFQELMVQLEKGLWTSFNNNGLKYLIANFDYRKI